MSLGMGVASELSNARDVEVTGRSAEQASSKASGRGQKRVFFIEQINGKIGSIAKAEAN